jgi:hypothetical protein
MSVVVIGMDYPDNCCVCKIKSWDIEGYVCPFSGVDTLSIGRQTNCPLRPMPRKHGRLIEADSLKETLDYYIREAGWDEKTNQVLGWVKDEFIYSERTIVEAEGDD